MSDLPEREALDELLAIVREFDLDSLVVRAGESTYELVARSDAPAVAAPAALA
ncbi:MAG: hypothetical protein IAI48_17315, partial [Candidatus Eremiobacteraeota bacterium]|nr:hypothetical protein [Candidatus Eremiobacteraeota bacterium]